MIFYPFHYCCCRWRASQIWVLITLSTHWRPPYLPDFLFNDFIDKMFLENKKEKLELLKGLSLRKDDTIDHITPLQQEVLIVKGEHDQIFLLEKATKLKELLWEKARLKVIKNASHVPQLEHGAKFNEIVNDYLCGSVIGSCISLSTSSSTNLKRSGKSIFIHVEISGSDEVSVHHVIRMVMNNI